ncbi:MAG: plasmid mobilization relaxosome protein MobC [Clostridia bacterium]|nr:plasmid mobilization relaxosome protein MobC [Clostridia bacterium]
MRKRNVQVLFRLDKNETQDFNKKVKKSGLSRETFLRQMIAGYELHEKPDDEFYDTMREISVIGNRVNQIAAKANALGFVDVLMFKDEAKKWSKFQLEIRDKYLLPTKV